MSALRDRRFRRILGGYALSTFGDSALYITLGIWAKDLTDSNAAAGLVFLCLGAPGLFGPLIGHLIDRMSRRAVLIGNDLVTGSVVLSLLAVRSEDQLWIIYVVALCYGMSFTVLSAARGGLIKDMLPPDDLGAANAAFQTISQGVRLFSPLVGAALYATVGGQWVAVLDAATFAVGALVMWSVKVVESAVEPHGEESYLRQVAAGFVHLRRTPVLAQIVVAAGVAFTFLGFTETAEFALIDEGLHRSPSFLGVLTSVQGGGSILGGITAAWILRRAGETRAVGLGLVLFAVGDALAIVAQLPVVVVGIFLAGTAIPWMAVGYGTALQKYTPPRLMGRTGASANLMLDVPQTVSIAVGAALISAVDYRIMLAMVAIGVGVGGLALLIRPVPVPQPDAPPAEEPALAVP